MSVDPGPRCSECGASLQSASEGGMCASCAFQLALGVSAGLPPDTAPSGDRSAQPPAPEIPGYGVRELLGRGGMGDVWRAEQREPVRRDVAIKVIRAGFDSQEVAARFEAERQALAMMDHPNVARFFDAGTTSDSRPYVVMEYVPGVPITEFCDERRMSVKDRVRLFSDVCETVHHAHQKGILHRDLKPSNILVLDRDGKPEPKVIDFGIAKATRPRIFDHTQMTRADQLLGTPEYMSPEQMAEGDSSVDVRSDVYSLGAVFYELLTGTRPFQREALTRGGLDEVLRVVREVEHPTPSERVTGLGDRSRDAALARATQPRTLVSTLRGDLDWIAMKALEKEPERRYGSASQLAEDGRRYLRSEPVLAGPPGLPYRARKFVRRHPAGVAAGAVLLLSLVVFAVGMALQAERVARERDRANEQAEVSREVKNFLVELFRVSNPSEARGNEMTAREILDRGVDRIREEVTDPGIRAELVAEMGAVYRNLGLFDEAEPLFRELVDLRAEAFGMDDARTLTAGWELARVHKLQGRPAAAESLLHEVVDGYRRVAGDEDPGLLRALTMLGATYRDQGRMDEAEAALLPVLDVLRGRDEADEADVIPAIIDLAWVYQFTGQLEKSLPLFEEALERRRRLFGDDHPKTLNIMPALADIYTRQKRHGDARALLGEAAEGMRRVLGEAHPDYFLALQVLGNHHLRQGEVDSATALYARVLDLRRTHLGPEHPHTLNAMHALFVGWFSQGRIAEADSLGVETLELQRRILGEDHPSTRSMRANLAGRAATRAHVAASAGDRIAALDALREAVDLGFTGPMSQADSTFARFREDPEFAPLFDVIHLRAQEN